MQKYCFQVPGAFLAIILSAVPVSAAAIDLDADRPTRPTPEQVAERLGKRLPKVAALTAARQPLHIALIGDSVTRGFLYEDDIYDMLKTYSGVFAGALTKQFFYTGGVRALNPGKNLPTKTTAAYGPEITLENFSRNGARDIQPLMVVKEK